MIINVAGTNGSGKTTAVKAVLAKATSQIPIIDGNKVTGYICEFSGVTNPTVVIGEYRDDLGSSGCDSIKDTVGLFARIEGLHVEGKNVIYEGMKMMNHMRGIELQRRTKALCVVHLNTPWSECERRIRARRAARGADPDAPISDDVRGTVKRTENFVRKVRGYGARIFTPSSDEAPAIILGILQRGE